jgi:dihydrofolate reductase
MNVKLVIIAAIAKNRVIGKDGKLPWHISDDLKRFKRLTSGHAILMGRRTYESLGQPLPHRRNVVLTSRPIPGVETYPSLPEALNALKDQERVFVIGGGNVFSQLIEHADALYLTHVERDVQGDVFFPPYEHLIGKIFRLVAREDHNGYAFLDYARLSPHGSNEP